MESGRNLHYERL